MGGLAGLGAFLKGAGEGYENQTKLQLIQEKDRREGEMFGIQKQNAQMDLDQKKKEVAYQSDLQQRMKALQSSFDGGVTGEVLDPATGESLGMQTFKVGAVPPGVKFKEGTLVEKPPLDPFDRRVAQASIFLATAADHGKVDLGTLEQSIRFTKMAEFEYASRATKHFMANPNDEAGARAILEKGGIKLGDDIRLGLQKGPGGEPNVIGYRVDKSGSPIMDKDGNPQIVFDAFQHIILPSASADVVVASKVKMGIADRSNTTDIAKAHITGKYHVMAAGVGRRGASADEKGLPTLKDVLQKNADHTEKAKEILRMSPQAGLNPDAALLRESRIGAGADAILRHARYGPNVGVATARNMAADVVDGRATISPDGTFTPIKK